MLDLNQYLGLLVFVILGILFVLVAFGFSALFRERGTDPLRQTVYECGVPVTGTPFVSPNIRFYVFALLFVIFDSEVAFILPWAVKFKELGWVGFIEMMVFIAVLFVALVYAWRKGAMRWE
ncbi:MAG: NADH-quinone oxidoreductase subunit A [Elusimicrobia bacterium]|nr:NADH-quinone oxidoreductase subunit A [Candidatus Obscuribacterium magneticum]